MKWFDKYVVAKVDEPGSYENSGMIVQVRRNRAILWTFGHCSCNGTWPEYYYDAKTGKSMEWFDGKPDWAGTPDQLVELAKSRTDVNVPGKTIREDDFDFKQWNKLYQLILEWDAAGRPQKAFEFSF